MHRPAQQKPHREILSLAILVVIAGWAVATLHPDSVQFERQLPVSSAALAAWILLQMIVVVLCPLAFWWLLQRWSVRGAQVFGHAALLSLPIVMVVDTVLFQWTGERLLSLKSLRFLAELSHTLWPYVTQPMIRDGGLLVASLIAGCWGLRFLARMMAGRWDFLRLSRFRLTGCVILAATLSVSCGGLLTHPQTTANWMAGDSTRHPFCIFRVLPHTSPASGALAVSASQAAAIVNTRDEPAHASESAMEAAVAHRELLQRTAVVSKPVPGVHLPDALIVVIESLRNELVQPEIMPQLAEIAERGIHLRQHFSGGNATNHGMFSLMNGLDATWFERPVRYAPLMNRLFREAGYEVGFFAGENQWREFLMDGFIRPEQFDVYQCTPRDGLRSDRLATQNAAAFLGRTDKRSHDANRPRLAIVYLYGTHATYQSYVEDQVFQPAADDRIRYPYGADRRDQVWNRYKNSARTIDRFLSRMYRDDLVAMITGDHGESFLEDGTIGHGIKISAVQNMTPAVIYSPSLSSRNVSSATSHADLLPTLLELIGLDMESPGLFDGVSLVSVDDVELDGRVLVTRNYLDDVYGLIGTWTEDDSAPFAYRASISLNPFRTRPLNQIDSLGFGAKPATRQAIEEAIERWRDGRFPSVEQTTMPNQSPLKK